MESILHNCVLAAQKYYANPTDVAITSQLEGKLEMLISETQDPVGCGKLTKESATLADLLGLCSQFISSAKVTQELRASMQSLLYNIAWFNIPLRGYLAGELQLCTSIYESLRISLRDQLGPKSLVDCLQLLQVLTYDPAVTLSASWSSDLLKFLIKEIISNAEKDVEWVPFCVGILNNLCTHFATVREQVRKHERVTSLNKRLVALLASQSPAVVIYSLSLISYLEERLRNTVYATQNLNNTFQCVFNVLIRGDSFMARHTAVDLFIRLVVERSDRGSRLGGVVANSLKARKQGISALGQSLVSFPHLDKSLKSVAALLVQLDWQREQVSKIYDLLLIFCSIEALRQPTCVAIMQSEPINPNRLVTPLLAMVQVSLPSLDESTIPEIPLKAAKLLRIVLEEVVNSNYRIQEYLHIEPLLNLVEASVKTTVETSHPQVAHQCRRIVEGLTLAKVISQDDDMRTDLLDVVSASLCAHIAEFQMLSNPVSTVLGKAKTTGDTSYLDSLPDWSSAGVEILLELLQVVAELKNHSGYHKQQYWKLLKDDRLIPFLAYGISYAETDLVSSALLVILQCSQVHGFPFDWLSELISLNGKANARKRKKHSSHMNLANGSSIEDLNSSVQMMDFTSADNGIPLTANNGFGSTHGKASDGMADIDQLIAQMKGGLEFNDPRLSQVLDVFEKKIKSLEAKEKRLQSVLDAKQTLLQKTEQVVGQYRGQQTESEQEVTKLRQLIREGDGKCDEVLQRVHALAEENERLQTRLEISEKTIIEKQREEQNLKHRLSQEESTTYNLKAELDIVSQELESEKALSENYRQKYLDNKKNFETISKKLLDSEERCKQLDVIKVKLETAMADKEDEVVRFERSTDKLQTALQRLEEEKRALYKQVSEKDASIRRLQADLQEQKKLTDMINKLTSKNKDS